MKQAKQVTSLLRTGLFLWGTGFVMLSAGVAFLGPSFEVGPKRHPVIVQGKSLEAAVEAVRSAGGRVDQELEIIRAVSTTLSTEQLRMLGRRNDLKLHADRAVEVAGDGGEGGTVFPAQLGAHDVHAQGIDGSGVTIAFVDTGIWRRHGLADDRWGNIRLRRIVDTLTNLSFSYLEWLLFDPFGLVGHDRSGHGSHVLSGAVNSRKDASGNFNGMAPDADIVAVKAFNRHGQGTYGNVIQGIDWVVRWRNTYNIRVLNLSFSAPPVSHYWDDPLNEAVMKAWEAGIVVVASAGNLGPAPFTIGVPGNVPYIITVGAMSDGYTSGDPNDDFLASFSGAGPTYEGFIKPEVIAPGGHVLSLLPPGSEIWDDYPEHAQQDYFTMSGTSQATGIVSGIVALMLDQDPSLTPDEVKCRLMDSARPAVDASGMMGYSVFQQGAGLVDAYDAVYSTATGCANLGINVDDDLANLQHFGGPANQDGNGDLYLVDTPGDGFTWNGQYNFGDRRWRDTFSNYYAWNDGNRNFDSDYYVWNDSLNLDGYLWTAGLTEPMEINAWVGQE